MSLVTGKAAGPPPPTGGKASAPPLFSTTAGGATPCSQAAVPCKAPASKGGQTAGLVGVHNWKNGAGREQLSAWLDASGQVCLGKIAEADPFLRPLFLIAQTDMSLDWRETMGTLTADPERPPLMALRGVEEFFRKKAHVALKPAGHKTERRSALEPERQKLIGLALGGALGTKSRDYQTLMQAIERGDETILTAAVASALLQLVQTVKQEEVHAVVAAAESKAEDMEDTDRFIVALSKVTKPKQKLECILYTYTFEEQIATCESNLNLLIQALQTVTKLLPKLRHLFHTAQSVGNRFVNSPVNSVSLTAVAKLTEVKSPLDGRLDLLHFVVALLPETTIPMFSDADIAALRKAALVRAHRVRDEAKDLLDGIEQLRKAAENDADTQPELKAKLTAFLSNIQQRTNDLATRSLKVFTEIKLLAAALDDFKLLYPPPNEKTNDNADIFEALANLGGAVRLREKGARSLKIKILELSKNHPSSPVKPRTLNGSQESEEYDERAVVDITAPRSLSGTVFTHVRTQNFPILTEGRTESQTAFPQTPKAVFPALPFAKQPALFSSTAPVVVPPSASSAIPKPLFSPSALFPAPVVNRVERSEDPSELTCPFTPPGGFRESRISGPTPGREVVLPSSRPGSPQKSTLEPVPKSVTVIPRLSLASMRTSETGLLVSQVERQTLEVGPMNSSRGNLGSNASALGSTSARGHHLSARGRIPTPVIGRDNDGIDGFLRRVESSESSRGFSRPSLGEKRVSGGRLSLGKALTMAHRLRQRDQMLEPGIQLTPCDQNARGNKPSFTSTHLKN